MGNTTNLWGSQGAGFSICQQLYGSQGGGFFSAKQAWEWNGFWEGRYSTPTVSCGNVSGSDSGAGSSGFVTSTGASPSIGGNGIGPYAYSWAYVSGDSGIACSNASSANPTWSKTVGTNTTVSAVWQLTVTDLQTGATTTTTITVSLYYLQNLSVTANNINQNASGIAPSFFFNGQSTANPVGGIPGYTYSWGRISGDAIIACSSTTAQAPFFSVTISPGPGTTESRFAVWRCTVTDSVGHTTYVDVQIFYEYSRN